MLTISGKITFKIVRIKDDSLLLLSAFKEPSVLSVSRNGIISKILLLLLIPKDLHLSNQRRLWFVSSNLFLYRHFEF